MRILAFDMSSHTGWAVSAVSGDYPTSGVIHFMRGKRLLELEERLCKFRFEVNGLLDRFMPEAVCYEIAHFRGGAATRSGVGMETVLKMECYMRGVPCLGVHSATLKKFATGKGRAEKSDMMAVASKVAGRRIRDDNEADAICITEWGVANVEVGENGHVTLKNVTPKRKTRRK